MNIKTIIILSLFVVNISVLAQSTDIMTINLTNPHVESIPVSRLFSKMEYIPLELAASASHLENIADFYLTDKFIIGINIFDNAWLFDRGTGKYLREISKPGHGKDEYSRIPVSRYGFDEKKDILFFDDGEQWKGIKLETNKAVINVLKPENRMMMKLPDKELDTDRLEQDYYSGSGNEEGDWIKGIICNPWAIGDDKFIGFVNNTTGNINVRLVLFDKEGKVFRSFPNYQKYEKNSMDSPFDSGQFYNYKDNTYFKELSYSDTVYLIKEDTMIPHIVFQLGDKKMLYEYREYDLLKEGNITISFVQETDHHVFFNYYVCGNNPKESFPVSGYYDKDNKQTYVCRVSGKQGGFENDFDNLMTFTPLYINNKGEVLGKLNPGEMLDYYHTHPETKFSERAEELLNKISADSNPVIIIAYPK